MNHYFTNAKMTYTPKHLSYFRRFDSPADKKDIDEFDVNRERSLSKVQKMLKTLKDSKKYTIKTENLSKIRKMHNQTAGEEINVRDLSPSF